MLPAALSVLPAATAALAFSATETVTPPAVQVPAAAILAAPQPAGSEEITVLTYNVRGLPWPFALNRAKALEEIGRELAEMRREGSQPTVVLIQEGFRREVADLVKASGYRYWARGPSRLDRAEDAVPIIGKRFKAVRYRMFGEGWGKLTSGGLHILSDLPIVDIRNVAYRYCAGWDCLANKGAMLARVKLADAPVEIDIVNTHMNSKRASAVPRARSSRAHNLQTDELIRFINANGEDRPVLIGGDFNVKGAPERYYHQAAVRPYTVVSEYCTRPDSACAGEDASASAEPWLKSQDLQAFIPQGVVAVRPEEVATLFGPQGKRRMLSDHKGYLVRYRLSWNAGHLAAAGEAQVLQVADSTAP